MSQLEFFDKVCEPPPEWIGNRKCGLDRLHAFVPKSGRAYAATRNFDFGPENRANISCLSPWIRHRLILEEDVLRETLARFSLSTAEKFIQEVFWRGYFKGWLEQKPDVWHRYCFERDELIAALDRDHDLLAHYQAATHGTTGIDCFDFWAKELVANGYLHNHARMWFASIWIFTLRLPWQLGADFFFRHLMDGDAATNTCSWRWVAGLHTKGKNYAARASNISKFTDGRFSPTGLANDPLPLVEQGEYDARPMPMSDVFPQTKPFGLLITEEDCNAESLPINKAPAGVIALSAIEERSSLKIGTCAEQFTGEALQNGLERATSHFQCEGDGGRFNDCGTSLVDFAKEIDVDTLVTAWLPVGPARDKMESAKPALSKAGINLVQLIRPYDQTCWPHATKGFFKLKAKIPKIVGELGSGPINL